MAFMIYGLKIHTRSTLLNVRSEVGVSGIVMPEDFIHSVMRSTIAGNVGLFLGSFCFTYSNWNSS